MTDADGDQNGCGGAFTLALEISENPKLPGGGRGGGGGGGVGWERQRLEMRGKE